MNIILYHYWRSSASWRVRWALELKKVPHEKVAINLLKGEEKTPDYLAKNPSGYLPCLMVNGKPLGESLAIIEWLEENYSVNPLIPGDSFERATVRRLAETVNSGIQPLVNLDVVRKFSDDKEKQIQWSKYWIERGLGVMEKSLGKMERKNSKFCMGDAPTLADICLIPQCYSALRNEVDLSKFPICKSIYEFALSTPECAASIPERFQPEA